MKMKKRIFAIPAAATEMPPKPNNAATKEIKRKIIAKRSIEILPKTPNELKRNRVSEGLVPAGVPSRLEAEFLR